MMKKTSKVLVAFPLTFHPEKSACFRMLEELRFEPRLLNIALLSCHRHRHLYGICDMYERRRSCLCATWVKKTGLFRAYKHAVLGTDKEIRPECPERTFRKIPGAEKCVYKQRNSSQIQPVTASE